MSTQKSKLIIKTFDGSMKKLNILPQNKETKIEFEIDYYDDNDALTNATLSFDKVIAIDFRVNYFDSCMWLQYNKIKNIELAIRKLDGVIVYPGETFSFWKLVGKTTVRKGYVEGMVLSHGKFKPGVGGGLCQLSNLIYWMTLHTPLQVTERHRHSYDVFPDVNRKLPFGSGATCFYNYIDLRILNDTSEPYQLHLYLTNDYLVGEWRTTIEQKEKYEVYQKDHWISHEYWGGYARHNTIFRKKYDWESKLIEDAYITENHAIMMYEPLLPNNTNNDR